MMWRNVFPQPLIALSGIGDGVGITFVGRSLGKFYAEDVVN